MKRKIDFDILESLRGLAALYVCIAHCRGVLWIGGEYFTSQHPRSTWGVLDYMTISLTMLTRLSTEFVIIFFVLSGFSIAHSLRNSTQPGGFYKRRFIRLYPPYLMAIIYAMAVAWCLRAAFPHYFDGTYHTAVFERLSTSNGLFNWKTFALNLVYFPQMGGLLNPFWSLTHEVIFYLLAPFLFRNKKAYYIGSMVLFLGINILIQSGVIHLHEYIPVDFLFYNFFFALGVGLYSNYERIVSMFSLLLHRRVLIGVGLIFLSMVGISLSKAYTLNSQWAIALNALLAATMSVMLILYLVTNNLRIKPLIQIGRFSYTLYITHFPTIFIYLSAWYYFTKAHPPYITNSLVFIPCIFFCLLMAYTHYQLIEKRTKYILDRLRKTEEIPAVQPAIEPASEDLITENVKL